MQSSGRAFVVICTLFWCRTSHIAAKARPGRPLSRATFFDLLCCRAECCCGSPPSPLPWAPLPGAGRASRAGRRCAAVGRARRSAARCLAPRPAAAAPQLLSRVARSARQRICLAAGALVRFCVASWCCLSWALAGVKARLLPPPRCRELLRRCPLSAELGARLARSSRRRATAARCQARLQHAARHAPSGRRLRCAAPSSCALHASRQPSLKLARLVVQAPMPQQAAARARPLLGESAPL